MRLIKKENLKYFYVGIIIILIFFLTVVKTKGQEQYQEPYTFDFENDSILDIDQEYNPNYYNIKNQSEYNGNYESLYSFDEFEIGTSFDDLNLFLDFNEINVNPYIDNYYGHSKVLLQNITESADSQYRWYDTFEQQSNGLISLWYITNDTYTVQQQIVITHDGYSLSGGNILVVFKVYENLITITTGNGAGGYSYITDSVKNNTWYYLEFDVSCTSDKVSVLINKKVIVDNYWFYHDNTFDYFDTFEVYCVDASKDKIKNAFDGIDYSWSLNYQFRQNFISELEINNYLEINKYEFDYNYDDFENGLLDWIQTEATSTYDYIRIAGNKDIDKYINFCMYYGAVYSQELTYEPNSFSTILNVSMVINLDSITPYDYKVYFFLIPKNKVDVYDNIGFRIDDDTNEFKIMNQTSESYETIFTITQDQEISINIYVNSYDGIYIYRILDGVDSYNIVYDYDIDNRNLYGFNNLYFYGYCNEPTNPSGLNMRIENFGIYENGLSIINRDNINDFGLMYYGISESWNSDSHNLLTIDSNNYFDIYVHNYYDYYLDGYLIEDKYNQTELRTINLQDSKDNNYPKFIYTNPYLIFKLFGNCTNFYEIEIEGIKLIDQNNNYVYGNYYYNYSNPLNNWFYAIDNKLYYNFNDSNDYVKETMRITFNIDDILLINESLVSYSSYITNNYSGYIYLSSYYSTETFDIINNNSLVNSYLNITDLEHFTLKEISIEINSNDNSNGLAKGYIQNINIYPTKPLFPDFEPIEYLESTFLEKMIETIIPILFFIVPSFIMKTRYGNKAVLPIWILLTLIFIIANFIPFWIGFIIFLSIGLMALNKDEVMN